MKVLVNVFTKDVDAAVAAYKKAVECGATDVSLQSYEDYDSEEVGHFCLSFNAEHTSEGIADLDHGPFVSEPSNL